MLLHHEAEEIVNKIISKVKSKGLKVRSIIVFGSAVRGGEFKPGVSDVDVVLIVDKLEDLKGERFDDISKRLELGIFTTGQFLELYFSGDPLAHMIWLEGQAIYDDGFYMRVKSKGKPRVTELTIMKLKHWGLKDLVNALKSKSDPRTCLRALHHAIRNFARLRVARDKGIFIMTDSDLLSELDDALSAEYRKLLGMVSDGKESSDQLILEALRLIERLYGDSLTLSRIYEGLNVE
ncbi:MAG: nucleotidyltransferase domain-containing protein [Candidatus Nezhaarchaeota archaeon]|nr:nucleotidyltransferase domain-containing protein [Candidatus Nezhaarchaeota archaeon]